MEHLVIIGNGIAGITAARHVRKLSDKRITVISKESDLFWSRTALMYIYMGHMRLKDTQPYSADFYRKNRIDLLRDEVTHIDTKEHRLNLKTNGSLEYDQLIIASGSSPNFFGWPGQDLQGVQGLYSLQDLQQLEENTARCKRAVIIGGGLIGIELAEMLRSRKIEVELLVRENRFWGGVLPEAEAQLVHRQINRHGATLHLETELEQILGDEEGRVRGVKTKTGQLIDCQLVGITTGVHPNISFLKDSGIETDRGVLVNRKLQTSAPDVYAIGDCAQQREAIGQRKALEQVWYTGRMMGEAVAYQICGHDQSYNPGIWFNSAKFFDLEYQTYGWVWNAPKEEEEHLYWEGEDQALRLVYHRENAQILGINAFGLRLRHAVCDRWLSSKAKIDQVLSELPQALFDPEFFKKNSKSMAESFRRQIKTTAV